MTIESGDELALLVVRSPAGRGNGRDEEDLVAGRHGQASGWWRSFGRIEGGREELRRGGKIGQEGCVHGMSGPGGGDSED